MGYTIYHHRQELISWVNYFSVTLAKTKPVGFVQHTHPWKKYFVTNVCCSSVALHIVNHRVFWGSKDLVNPKIAFIFFITNFPWVPPELLARKSLLYYSNVHWPSCLVSSSLKLPSQISQIDVLIYKNDHLFNLLKVNIDFLLHKEWFPVHLYDIVLIWSLFF